MGVAPLRLGIASFQATFSTGVQVLVNPRSRLTPFKSGPLHCGQLSAPTVAPATHAATTLIQMVRRTMMPPAVIVSQGRIAGAWRRRSRFDAPRSTGLAGRKGRRAVKWS
jgi:hypothetical protein